jgi:hypothetical protein
MFLYGDFILLWTLDGEAIAFLHICSQPRGISKKLKNIQRDTYIIGRRT